MNIQIITEEQWWDISDYASMPIPLREFDMSYPFVYDRRYGIFRCNFSCHQILMATIYEWEHGEQARTYNFPFDIADRYIIETPGTSFMSSVGGRGVVVGRLKNLNLSERRFFGEEIITEIISGD